MGQAGSHHQGPAGLGQLVGYKMAFGAVLQSQEQVKLLGYAYGGEHIVDLVGMSLERYLLAYHWQHGLQLLVIGGFFGGVLGGGFQLAVVLQGFIEQLAQLGGYGHT